MSGYVIVDRQHSLLLRHDPLFAVFVLLGILGIFKPYPTLADPGLVISLLSLFPEIYPRMLTFLRHRRSSARHSLTLPFSLAFDLPSSSNNPDHRPLPSNRHCPLTCPLLPPASSLPSSLDNHRNRQRELFLCQYVGFWDRERSCGD